MLLIACSNCGATLMTNLAPNTIIKMEEGKLDQAIPEMVAKIWCPSCKHETPLYQVQLKFF
jgi:ribosomal protein S27E